MRIFISFPSRASNIDYPWMSFIREQIMATLNQLETECNMDPYSFSREDDPPFIFPYFEQEDTHSRYILAKGSDGKMQRFYLLEPMYSLLFLWEPEDDYSDNSIELLYNQLGITPDSVVIPNDYRFLCKYYVGQSDPINLALLPLDPDNEDGETVLL